ncbi:bifunctional DNA-binding transcriptional regulator/O6-methylguanine-DNA methyltransferase Ada [Parendozoicomonas haliclonae]|uniref:Bifunctional transcriptional activator/DNA repair enzyme Ada n=2 Tax=Parendozoicomonas haliclonae TaxID=1960125 RepID=A0A1X7AR41_9GAMM|nr:Bifunctional transcriptional activator/DNA repair enzyme Ada [Parendozoicomonas haliclonae]
MVAKASTHAAQTVLADPRWQMIVNRDASGDTLFVYGVKTTGIYCRPSSCTRLPKPENVVFFDSPEAAEAAGFRPSLRNARDKSEILRQHVQLAEAACRTIEQSESCPTLNTLAAQAGLSPYHFQRVFKSVVGLSPKAYDTAWRARTIRTQLHGQQSITETIYSAGLSSSSRFYEKSQQMLGMRPKDYKAGGNNTDIHFAVGECSLGSILVAQSRKGVCAILLGDDPDQLARDLQDMMPKANLIGGDSEFEQVIARVVGLIETPTKAFDLPLDIRGTAFQERVWQALRNIPPGTTVTYTEIAEQIGQPSAVRAVANACGKNCLAVAIPCHRVIRSDGSLSGYRWGVERKQQLLHRESHP